MNLSKINMGDVKVGHCPFIDVDAVTCLDCYENTRFDSDQFLCTCRKIRG